MLSPGERTLTATRRFRSIGPVSLPEIVPLAPRESRLRHTRDAAMTHGHHDAAARAPRTCDEPGSEVVVELLVVGATGRTGRDVVDEAVRRGHRVRAFARSAGANAWPDGVTAVSGSAFDRDDVDRAMAGVDAVIVAIAMTRASDNPWARILTPLDLHTRAASVLTEAAARHGVSAYVTVSAHGVGDAAQRAGTLFLMLVRSSNIGVAYAELGRAEEIVAAAPIPWTIVRPTRLTLAAPTGRWRTGTDLVTTSLDRVPRGDVAAFLVDCAETGAHRHTRVSLTGA